MTEVAIQPVKTDTEGVTFHAFGANKCTRGSTPGEALDALAAQLPPDQSGTLVLLRPFGPDEFFTAEQQQRLSELMSRWRAARDGGGSLPAVEQQELDALIDAELKASGDRAAAIADALGR